MPKDVAADIAIWGAVEVATTIMAACIPVLRVLFQYIKSSAKRYHTGYEPGDGSHLKGTKGNTTIIAGPGDRSPGTRAGKDDDSGSDKSILERSAGVANQIVQTTEFSVQFDKPDGVRANEDSDSMGAYEMTNRREAA